MKVFDAKNIFCLQEILDEKFVSPGHFLEELKYLLHNSIIYFGGSFLRSFYMRIIELVFSGKASPTIW